MLLSNIPAKIAAIFAASGTKNTIPLTTAGVAHTNNASFDVGFPPITMTPVISGGLPPFGADMNGILNDVTAVQQWQSAGGLFPYDSAFSSTIGGYPMGAILLMASGLGTWQSTVDNNTSNPDTGGANWSASVNQSQVLGVAQTLQSVIGSRTAGTTYTNSTGKPIVVYVYGNTTAANGYISISISGVLLSATTQPLNTAGLGMSLIIPTGLTYAVNVSNVTLANWYELR